MDENTNLNETNQSTETTPVTDSPATETSTTEAPATETSAFSMPADPADTTAADTTASDNAATETVINNDVNPATETAPVTESINSESYASDYATSENSGSYPSTVTETTANPYADTTTQATYGTVESASDFSNGFAIASLVLGILAIIFGCCCTFLGVILGIIGVVLGCLQKPDPATGKKPGMAIAGIICSAVGIVGSIIFMIVGAASVLADL